MRCACIVALKVNQELPLVFTSTAQGASLGPATSELSTLSPGLNGRNKLETLKGSMTSIAGVPKPLG